MSCCAPGVEAAADNVQTPEHDDETLMAASHRLKDGTCQIELNVPDIHCAACMATIENALKRLDNVETARVNFSTRRARVTFRPGAGRPSDIVRGIEGAGYRAFLLDPEADSGGDRTLKALTRALAVSGFAAGNIMLFSVSIWSGADAVTRDLFHWISALIALPAVAYAGQPFFRSAFSALRHGHLNMDVPISLAVVLAAGMSLIETINHGAEAYFDASVSLLFFLLIGRTLDHLMREKARGAVRNLARLAPRGATRIMADGATEHIAIAEIRAGMRLELPAGERVPVDCIVETGRSDIDLALVTGESVPEAAEPGTQLLAGATNLTGPLIIRAEQRATESFLARMITLMEAAEGSKAGYKRIADRAAAIYAPAVHLLALFTLIGWAMLTGDWHAAVVNAIAVLIITCPCALALAVPIVHVVASGRLFSEGVMMRDGAALERLAEVDTALFDKTGTLTEGRPRYVGQIAGDPEAASVAAALASLSRHPLSRALAESVPATRFAGEVREVPGEGIEGIADGQVYRLGRVGFATGSDSDDAGHSMVWLSRDGTPLGGFGFADPARADAAATIAAVKRLGLKTGLVSGDRPAPVKALAEEVGIADFQAGLSPADKLAAIAAAGDRVLMVGDGINDAPALRAASVSMAPSSAADIGRNAADFVLTRSGLGAVPFAIALARRAALKVKVNFGLAIAYNAIAIPLAVSGQVTPLFAALAMSSSSILVTLNALTLNFGQAGRPASRAHAARLHPAAAE
ncbi:MAG: cadmium-translocating P-type ATPase [Alphaproteobacteria bacterium]|nr:cadmium-translocating P-type ATPase [Alphaproteobacteria bacterium]